MTRLRITYRGQVQGVGFRVTVRYIARELTVSGWVRNEHDGSVSLEVQGDYTDIAALREGIQRDLGSGIDYQQVEQLPVTPGEHGFEIRYW